MSIWQTQSMTLCAEAHKSNQNSSIREDLALKRKCKKEEKEKKIAKFLLKKRALMEGGDFALS